MSTRRLGTPVTTADWLETSTGPAAPTARTSGHRLDGNWRLALLAGLVVLLGALAVIAPVTADNPVVSWPQAGTAPTSTVLPLSPWRPLSLTATVPCATLRAVNQTGGTVLSTQPSGDQGLKVSAQNGTATFSLSGQQLLSEPIRPGNCDYQIVADSGGARIVRDGTPLAQRPGLLPPQVAQLATDAQGLPAARGLAVRIHTDARYQSSPSTLKLVLLIAHALCLVVLLLLAWRRWSGGRSGNGQRVRVLVAPSWSWADAALLVVSGAWVFLGPMNMDDGWYQLMARNASVSGHMGNYIHMFNATENPFVLSQYAKQFWGELGGWSLWWMRLVPVTCAVVTWFLLRTTLATMLGRAATLRVVPWALLVAHLLWFLPDGTSLRPEPMIVTCSAATLLFAEAARRSRSIGALAMATLFAALGMSTSPSGVVAAAPLVLAIPWLASWLRQRGWSTRIAVVFLALATVTVVVPVGFADATLGDVMDATRTHQWYYFALPWYDEFVHYNTLLNVGGWSRRLPVLLTVALLVFFALAHGRRLGTDPLHRLVLTSGITSAIAFGLIALSPTKWVDHFPAVAAAPTLLIAAALIRSPLPRRAGPVIRIAGVLIIVGAVSLSYAGGNTWHPFSDAGQRFGNHLDVNPLTNNVVPHFGPLYLRDPLPWLVVALAAWAWAAWRRRNGKRSGLDPDRSVLVVACVGAVVLMLGLFAYAPVSQAPAWTVARSGFHALSGNGCGLATDVKVLLPSRQQLGPARGPAKSEGDFLAGQPPALSMGPWADQALVWHDDRPEGTTTGTGSLTTGWYPLPPTGGTHVVVPVAGALAGQRLEVQFGTGDPAAPRVVETRKLEPDTRQPLDVWQQLPAQLPAQRPSAIRVSVSDVVTGANSWIAVAEPKLTELRSVNELTAANPQAGVGGPRQGVGDVIGVGGPRQGVGDVIGVGGPRQGVGDVMGAGGPRQGVGDAIVFADEIASPLWPCVRQARIVNGISDAPTVRLTADEFIPEPILANPTSPTWGGAWVQATRASQQIKLYSELRPQGPPRLPWGQVFAVRYRYPAGQYDLHVDKVSRSGLTRLPTLATNAYPDIAWNDGVHPGH